MFRFLAGVLEQPFQVQRTRVFDDVGETLRDFRVREAGLAAQTALDRGSNRLAGTGQVPGHGGFVFVQQPPRLRERQPFRIVAAEPKLISCREGRHGRSQRFFDRLAAPVAVGIGFEEGRCRRPGRFVVRQRFDTLA